MSAGPIRPTILVVDDHDDSRELAVLFLSYEGFGVLVAEHVEQALELLEQTLPALIITDLSMPRITGWTLIELLRANPRTTHIPVVMVTGHADAATRERALAAGFAGFFPKPVALEELIRLVRALIDSPAQR